MSLKRMVLRDFVIVRELDLALNAQFTVLTGETGAGKSILIDALQLVTGGRADVGLIREGANRTDVSAEFEATPALQEWLDDAGYQAEDALLLRRTVDLQGKSRAWINGSPATATQLRNLGEQLLDIHGQHAWQSLTTPDSMASLLDAYAQTSSVVLAACWQQWRMAQQKLQQACLAQDTRQQDRERLSWQISELQKLAPRAHEWPDLNAEHTRLANTQALIDAAQGCVLALDENDANARSSLHKAIQLLQQQTHIEPYFAELIDVLTASLAQLEDSLRDLHSYLRKTELEPERLSEIDARMGLWVALARRYKRHPSELPALLESWQNELSALDASNDLQTLEQAQASAERAYLFEAQKLSQARAAAAPQLATAITNTMQELGMPGGQFRVQLQNYAEPSKNGLEEVCFLIAGHAGITPRAINKIASGGELSRLALAIAVTTSQIGSAQTLVFDEVDSGIGGAVAQTVGRLMQQLGCQRQVLAVTHLPQVAACATHHLVVSKQLVDGSTTSQVNPVVNEARVAELARMLGGERMKDSTLAHARDLFLTQGS